MPSDCVRIFRSPRADHIIKLDCLSWNQQNRMRSQMLETTRNTFLYAFTNLYYHFSPTTDDQVGNCSALVPCDPPECETRTAFRSNWGRERPTWHEILWFLYLSQNWALYIYIPDDLVISVTLYSCINSFSLQITRDKTWWVPIALKYSYPHLYPLHS